MWNIECFYVVGSHHWKLGSQVSNLHTGFKSECCHTCGRQINIYLSLLHKFKSYLWFMTSLVKYMVVEQTFERWYDFDCFREKIWYDTKSSMSYFSVTVWDLFKILHRGLVRTLVNIKTGEIPILNFSWFFGFLDPWFD